MPDSSKTAITWLRAPHAGESLQEIVNRVTGLQVVDQEALANIREAIVACLEVRAERGMPLTVETQQVEVTV